MTKALLLLVLSCFAASDALVIGARPAVKRVAVRAQEAPSPPPKGRLGATVDQDGKSNVWVRAGTASAIRRPQPARSVPHGTLRAGRTIAYPLPLLSHFTHPCTMAVGPHHAP